MTEDDIGAVWSLVMSERPSEMPSRQGNCFGVFREPTPHLFAALSSSGLSEVNNLVICMPESQLPCLG